MRGRLRAAVAMVGAVSVMLSGVLRADITEANGYGSEFAKAGVTAGYWPTSGSAAAQAGTVTSASGLSILAGGTPPPWPGPTTSITQAAPGRSEATSAGPYSSGSVLGTALRLRSSGASGGAVSGSVCSSYTFGPAPRATPCTADRPVSATSSLTSYLLRADILSVGVAVGTDVIELLSPIRTSASCNLDTGSNTYSATDPVAGTPISGFGQIRIGGQAVNIPAPGSTQPVSRNGVTATVRSTKSTTGAARSRLTVDGSVTLLGLVTASFDVVLAESTCTAGATSPTSTASSAVGARAVNAKQTSADTTSPAVATTTATETTGASATTSPAPATTTTSGPSTTTTVDGSATTSAGTTTTTTTSAAPSTTSAVPTTTSAAPTTTTTSTSAAPTTATTAPTTTTAPATTFTGPAEDAVTRLTTTDGVVCTAADGGGLSCDDGTTVPADAVTPAAVAAATVQGVWTPRTTDGAPVRVVSAVRG